MNLRVMESFSRQEARAGLQGITTVAISYYLFLLITMSWQRPFCGLLLLNRLVSLGLFAWARWQFDRGRVPPERHCQWSLALGGLGLMSLSLSYVLGFNAYVAARITVMMVFSALVGLPWRLYGTYLGMCLATCVLLQYWFPTSTDPQVNLAIPFVGLLLSLSIFTARRRIGRILFSMQSDLNQRGCALETTLAQAQQLQSSLDFEVARATWALENTNQQLQQAIDEQVRTFEHNQKLHREMADKLRYQALGKAAGAAAHDLNNLLAVISGSLEMLEEELAEPEGSEGRQLLDSLNRELNRCVLVGREVLALSGRYLLRSNDFELREWLGQVVATLPAEWKPDRIQFLEAEEFQAWLRCDQSQLRAAFLKLLRNAREASPEGTIWLSLRRSGADVYLSIEDDGSGVAERVFARLFEPFITTKDPAQHAGLGLAAARSILRQQGGEGLYFGPRKSGSGARFGFRMPYRGSLD
jgi:signal transduction histidine kinase